MQEDAHLLPLDSLARADGLVRECFHKISNGNENASFPDEVCGESINEFLEIMKTLEVTLTNLHSSFLQDEQKRITKVCWFIRRFYSQTQQEQEVEDLEAELERKDALIDKTTTKLKQWDDIFSDKEPMED